VTVPRDANGNTLSMRSLNLGYTSDNRLKSLQGKGSYTYNGFGQRVLKARQSTGNAASQLDDKTVFIYGLNGELLAELGATGQVKREYIYKNKWGQMKHFDISESFSC